MRLALIGLFVGSIAYLLYGLAPQGWMMYAIIVGNFVSFAAGPALQGIVSNASAPFGGIKQSGFGREGGYEGIEEYLDTKYVAVNL